MMFGMYTVVKCRLPDVDDCLLGLGMHYLHVTTLGSALFLQHSVCEHAGNDLTFWTPQLECSK